MTITRILQEPFDHSLSIAQYSGWGYLGNAGANPYSPSGYTGYCFVMASSSEGIYKRVSATAQARFGFMFRVTSSVVAADVGLWFVADDVISSPVLELRYAVGTDTWTLYAGATTLATFVLAVDDNTWRHIGVDFKIDAASGWCSVYIDGVAQISYTGQTDQSGSSDFDIFAVGPRSNSYDGWNSLYVDDLYLDDMTGEASPTPPSLKRFYVLDPNGNGNYAQWHNTDGTQSNNYSFVNDRLSSWSAEANDGVESGTSNHRDSWTMDDTPAGVTDGNIVACIAEISARPRSWGQQYRIFLRENGTDDDSGAISPTPGMEVDYARFTTAPDGSAWTKAKVDATELGVKFE